MPTQIQLRRDTAADWTSNNPTLAAGEFGFSDRRHAAGGGQPHADRDGHFDDPRSNAFDRQILGGASSAR